MAAPLFAVTTYLLLALHTIAAGAASPTIELTGPIAVSETQGHIDYLLDPDWTLGIDDVRDPPTSIDFQPVERSNPDFGYTRSAIWLRFSLRNAASEHEWRLLFRENFLQLFEVYLVRPGGVVETLTSLDVNSAFKDRPLESPVLAAPFHLAQKTVATVFVRYWSGGSSELSFSIENKASFDAHAARTTAKNFIYYGMILILIIISCVAFLMTRRPVFLAYSGYSCSALLFIMHADGNAFRYLWPNEPYFNAYATIALGSGIIIFGAVFAMLFLQTRRFHPFIDKILGGIIVLTAAMLVASAFVDNQPIKKLLVLLAFAAIVVFVVAGLAAARHRFKQVRFYVLAWAGAVISSAIMTGRHWLGIEISEEVQFDSIRIVAVSDAALMGLAIWDHFNQLRQARQSALQASLTKTLHNLELSQRLEKLEEQYAITRELAEQQGRAFADTIHDLNQPLHALRLDLRKATAARGVDVEGQARIEDTLAYLEDLVAGHLQGAISHAKDHDSHGDASCAGILGIGEVLQAIHDMFAVDARAKGIQFRYVETSARSMIRPLVLMRVVTNLVANAIKYTERGTVLLGCRRIGGNFRVEVHDTGSGMSVEEFERATARSVRLNHGNPGVDGHGLGLAIASALADEHGLRLTLATNRRSGTGIILSLPDVEEPKVRD